MTTSTSPPIVFFMRGHPDAVIPEKMGPREVGYDLTIISVHQRIDADTIMFDTGILTQPPDGYYFEIIPRSSIYKTGWVMANSVGVIDPTYRDTLKIVLTRPKHDSPEIALPSRIAQLVLRQYYPDIETRVVNTLTETYRTGGFGSTG